MMKHLFAIVYHFLLEIILVLLFLFLFYIKNDETPPIFLFAGLSIGGITLFILLLTKFKQHGKWLYFFTVFPLLGVISYLAGWSFFAGVGLAVFVFWRGISLFDEVPVHAETLLLLASFLIGVLDIIYSALSNDPFQRGIIYLLIMEIVLVVFGGFLKKWASTRGERLKFVGLFSLFLVALTVIGGLFTFLLPFIRFLFFGLFQFMAIAFSWLAKPLFSTLEYILSLTGDEKTKSNQQGASDLFEEASKYKDSPHFIAENSLTILLGIGVVLFLLYLIRKKIIGQKSNPNGSASFVEIVNGGYGQSQQSLLRKRIHPPEDIIRKEIFEFEKYARRHKFGRLSNETLEEWFLRVGLNVSNESINIYDKVRYGEDLARMEEQEHFKAEFHQLKKQLKAIKNSLNKTV